MQFEMLIEEIFNFQEGGTVFVGYISGENKFIRKCDCDLIIDGQFFRKVHIEGERMPGNKPELRVLSAIDTIDKSEIPYKSAKVLLRCSS